jgi:hypothetical protein
VTKSSSSSRLLGQDARIPCAEDKWSAAAEHIRAINEGETVDFREARLTASICASASARLKTFVNQRTKGAGGRTDDEQRLLLLIYRLGDVVYLRLGQDLMQRRI